MINLKQIFLLKNIFGFLLKINNNCPTYTTTKIFDGDPFKPVFHDVLEGVTKLKITKHIQPQPLRLKIQKPGFHYGFWFVCHNITFIGIHCLYHQWIKNFLNVYCGCYGSIKKFFLHLGMENLLMIISNFAMLKLGSLVIIGMAYTWDYKKLTFLKNQILFSLLFNVYSVVFKLIYILVLPLLKNPWVMVVIRPLFPSINHHKKTIKYAIKALILLLINLVSWRNFIIAPVIGKTFTTMRSVGSSWVQMGYSYNFLKYIPINYGIGQSMNHTVSFALFHVVDKELLIFLKNHYKKPVSGWMGDQNTKFFYKKFKQNSQEF
jgi:hypothetical protein